MHVSHRSAPLLFLTVLLFVGAFLACDQSDRPQRILVFTKTAGYRHESIEPALAILRKLGRDEKFEIFHTEDADKFTDNYLKTFSAVVFLSTTGDVLNNAQQVAFERYIQSGGGFVGVHAAADTEYDWPWYGKLVGGYFESHPNDPNVRDAVIDVLVTDHPSTEHLGKKTRWERTDEWYNYKNLNAATTKLLNLDETSYEGGTNGDEHPIAWYHEYDGGRAFYTGSGHTVETYQDKDFQRHLIGGIRWAMGNNKRDYRKAVTHNIPPEDRFQKTVLAQNLDEPMELEVFDDGRVIFIERKGAIKLYDPAVDYLRTVHEMDVWTKYEDGNLGIAKDPDYADNHWVYLYYSPNGEASINRLSRFTFGPDSRWDMSTEKVMLEVPVQRLECCHAGGSVEFGPDGLLYLSLGDNSNPFASDGYTPIDERPGREPWDARRTSANTNDLRGGIIRIRPEADGSYSIPEGNLFAEGTPDTRPEIYAMGMRNPFRMHIDRKRNWLYWGDVGPDAGKDNDARGPKGMDEINVARAPGNYGWPLFRGDEAYHDYNFATGEEGPEFDMERPVNTSAFNTGRKELPPFQHPMIWYSYDNSEEFPWIGTGGKNPMAGPVYYEDLTDGSETRFPEYFDGKLFFYEWMRDWVYIVSMDSLGNFVRADEFMPGTEFSHPMDMEFGPDGSLYVLEYGQGWFAQNMDARLSRVDYIRGNRPPVPELHASTTVGGAPLTVQFDAGRSVDYDGDRMRYAWKFDKDKVQAEGAYATHTFTQPGRYEVELTVSDSEGHEAKTTRLIQVGNEAPEVAVAVTGNQSFFWDGGYLDYRVRVQDKEDGRIDPRRVNVSIDYLAEGYDMTEIVQGHQTADRQSPTARAGLQLIEKVGCTSCHAVDRKVNGPSYIQVAQRYADDPEAADYLVGKVIRGGGGNWGEQAMSAHPQLQPAQVRKMIDYILSLGGNGPTESAYPPAGRYAFADHDPAKEQGAYVLMASYADRGHAEVPSLRAQRTVVLRHPTLQAEAAPLKEDNVKLATIRRTNDALANLSSGRYFGYRDLDLTEVGALTVGIEVRNPAKLQVRLGKPDGQAIGEAPLPRAQGEGIVQEVTIPLDPTDSRQDLYILVTDAEGEAGLIDYVRAERRVLLGALR